MISRKLQRLALRLPAWMVASFLLLPILIIIPVSFTDRNYLSLPWNGLSVAHYQQILGSSEWRGSMLQSFIIAAASTVVSVVIGTASSIGCWLLADRYAKLIGSLIMLPLAVPPIILALGLYQVWISLGLLDTYVGVIIAHSVGSLPFVALAVSSSISGFDIRLFQAARGMGATALGAVVRVMLPNLLPGIFSGGIFAFVHSWDELVIVLTIASRRVITVPRRMWDSINEQVNPTTAAVAVILIVVTTCLLFLEHSLRKRKENPT